MSLQARLAATFVNITKHEPSQTRAIQTPPVGTAPQTGRPLWFRSHSGGLPEQASSGSLHAYSQRWQRVPIEAFTGCQETPGKKNLTSRPQTPNTTHFNNHIMATLLATPPPTCRLRSLKHFNLEAVPILHTRISGLLKIYFNHIQERPEASCQDNHLPPSLHTATTQTCQTQPLANALARTTTYCLLL